MNSIKLSKKFCVYIDFVKIDGKFIAGYVGKGNQNRVNGLGRNKHWNCIHEKYGWKRVIVFQTHDETHAFEVEMMWICDLHTYKHDPKATAYACNYTLGGEGVSCPSYRKGKKLPIEHSMNISAGKKGKPTSWSRPKSEEFKLFISQALKGVAKTDEHRQNVILAMKNPKIREICSNAAFLQHYRKRLTQQITLQNEFYEGLLIT